MKTGICAICFACTLLFSALPHTANWKEGLNLNTNAESLAGIYKDSFLIGCAYSARDLSGERATLIGRHFNVVTMENAMKPDALQPKAGEFAFASADELVASAQGAGLLLHGHTLAWHQQSPPWLNKDAAGAPLQRAEAERNLAAHIRGVAGHYAGKVLSWDVVNEAVSDNPANPRDWRASLRQTDWLKAFANGAKAAQRGEDYIRAAFLAAREADPGAKLYYNDYNLDGAAKAIAVAGMVTELNDWYRARGNSRLLIEGIGMQGHYNTETKPEDVEASIERFAALGVEVSITELDISVTGAAAGGLTPTQEKKQAELYARLFLVFKKHASAIARVTFWGLDDGSSWRKAQYPLLFNADLTPKEAFFAVADPEGYLGSAGGAPETAPGLSAEPAATTPVIAGETSPAVEASARAGFPWAWAALAALIILALAAGVRIVLKRKRR